MKNIDTKLNIASKIFYSAIISAAVFVIVFGVFMKFMFDTQAKFDQIINEELPKVQLSNQAIDALMIMKLEEKNILIASNTKNNLEPHIKQFELYETELQKVLSLLKNKIHTQFDEIANIENEYKIYVSNFERLISLVKENKIKEAYALSMQLKTNIESIRKNLEKISAFNYREIDKKVMEFDRYNSFVYQISIVIVLLVIIVQMMVAYSLFSYTRRKMKDIDEKINILQSRDFENITYEHQSLKDAIEFEKIEKTLINLILMLASYDETEQLSKKSKEAKIGLTTLLTEKTNIEDICDSACEFIARETNGSICAIYLQSPNSDLMVLSGSYCMTKKDLKFGVNDGIVGQVAKTQKSVFVSNLQNQENLLLSGTSKIYLSNIYAYPIIFNKTFFGVFEISGNFSLNEFEKDFIASSMEIIGYAISHYKKLNEISYLLQKNEMQQIELEQTNEVLIKNNDDLKTARLSLLDNNNKLNLALDDVNKKSRELEKTNKYKSEFLSNMSHELRTPLNSINILSSILSQNKDGNLTKKQVEQLIAIHNSGEDLLSLINDVLDFSKLESKMMQAHIESFNLKVLVKSLFDDFSVVMHEKEIDFDLQICEDDFGEFKSDKTKIKQIVKNFLSNAMKFTPKGGKISLFLKYEKNTNRPIIIGVKDSGIGIDPAKLEHIFLAFTQEDGSTSRRFGGTGLGLAISKNLSNLIHGEIAVESTKDEGSTFTLKLPQASSSHKPHQISLESIKTAQLPKVDLASDDDNDNFKKSILLIEDDPDYASLIKNEIARLGFICYLTQNGKDGIEMAKKLKPDAIMLDLTLPVIDGVNVLKILKTDLALRHIPVKIISAGVKDIALESLGAIEFVEKTSNVSVIEEAITTLVDFTNQKQKSILIVEDNPKNIKKLKDILKGDGVSITFAMNHKDATNELRNQNFDCIALNITIESFDSFKLIEIVKRVHCKLPIVAYSMSNFTPAQFSKVRTYSKHIIIKTAESDANIVEETSLFLHRFYDVLNQQQKTLLTKSFNTFDILDGKKILIVDDDPRNIFALDSIFENYNMNVLHAFDGQECLNVLEKNDGISLVIMDMMMPVMDGYEATKKIREIDKYQALPIIALTAKNEKYDRQKCIEAGANDYVTKPADATQLLQLMKIWMRGC